MGCSAISSAAPVGWVRPPRGGVDRNLGGAAARAASARGYDAKAIAANNLTLLHEFPEPGVPLAVIDGQIIDDEDWLSRLAS